MITNQPPSHLPHKCRDNVEAWARYVIVVHMPVQPSRHRYAQLIKRLNRSEGDADDIMLFFSLAE